LERGKVVITPSHVTGLIAVVVALCFLAIHSDNLSIVAASIFFTLACTIDSCISKIPNLLNLCLLIAGIIINTVDLGAQGVLYSFSGAALGIGLLLLPYLMGGMGAGDVKALGALGAVIGPFALLQVFVYMGLLGGGFALLHYLFRANLKNAIIEGWHSICASALTQRAQYLLPRDPEKSKESLRFPYSSAIALGYYCYVYWGGML